MMITHVDLSHYDLCLLTQALSLLEADYQQWLNGAEVDGNGVTTDIILNGFTIENRVSELKEKIEQIKRSHT